MRPPSLRPVFHDPSPSDTDIISGSSLTMYFFPSPSLPRSSFSSVPFPLRRKFRESLRGEEIISFARYKLHFDLKFELCALHPLRVAAASAASAACTIMTRGGGEDVDGEMFIKAARPPLMAARLRRQEEGLQLPHARSFQRKTGSESGRKFPECWVICFQCVQLSCVCYSMTTHTSLFCDLSERQITPTSLGQLLGGACSHFHRERQTVRNCRCNVIIISVRLLLHLGALARPLRLN